MMKKLFRLQAKTLKQAKKKAYYAVEDDERVTKVKLDPQSKKLEKELGLMKGTKLYAVYGEKIKY